MSKARIVEMSQTRNVLMEKNIMMRASHPYVSSPLSFLFLPSSAFTASPSPALQILCLHRTFKDKNSLYMLLEFCQGGDMFTLLGRYGGRLKPDFARHYAAVGE